MAEESISQAVFSSFKILQHTQQHAKQSPPNSKNVKTDIGSNFFRLPTKNVQVVKNIEGNGMINRDPNHYPKQQTSPKITGGNKIVVPVNQIKIMKGNGSTSPQGRFAQEKSVSPPAPFNRKQSPLNLKLVSTRPRKQSPEEDETAIKSDNEEQETSFKIMKSSISNKPKLKVERVNIQRICPSPPPQTLNQGMKENKAPINLGYCNKPVLATDLIKNMINGKDQNPRTKESQKQFVNPLKVKMIASPKTENQCPQAFAKDMRKHGLHKDIQHVNVMQRFFQNNSPTRDGVIQPSLIKGSLKIRNNSPPPVQGAAVIDIKRIPSPRDDKNGEQVQQSPNTQVDSNGQFVFPFQRRARSHSPPKDGVTDSTQNQENSPKTADMMQTNVGRGNKPVVAKTNFLIAHQGVVEKEESIDLTSGKEVEEWLMGSGGSAATVGSSADQSKLDQRWKIEKKVEEQPEEKPSVEDWMFKTFDPFKGDKKTARGRQPEKSQRGLIQSRVTDPFQEHKEENPFDVAHEPDPADNSDFGIEETFDEGNTGDLGIEGFGDLNNYMERMDSLVAKANGFR